MRRRTTCSTHSTDFSFNGFRKAAFEALSRLRAVPSVEQMQADRASLRREVLDPFTVYRDDIVRHWVIPRQLALETERNVFSRLVKNDFGAGGVHDHVWMSFYRHGRQRLTDVQLSHSVTPDGFSVGLYAGERSGDLFKAILLRIEAEPEGFLNLLNDLLASGYSLASARRGVTRRSVDAQWTSPLANLPDELSRARAIWLSRSIPADRVISLGPWLVCDSISALNDLEPLYAWLIEAETVSAPRG